MKDLRDLTSARAPASAAEFDSTHALVGKPIGKEFQSKLSGSEVHYTA